MTFFNLMFGALKTLVANRCYEDNFPQSPVVPVVPAIRIVLISGEVFPDICGNDFGTGSPRYQIDALADTAKDRNDLMVLISDAMNTLAPPAVLQGLPLNSFDADTKRYVGTVDYIFQPSSAP